MTKAEAGRKLLEELCSGLEGGESAPVTPLARKAMRLAALLSMDGYQMLFHHHIDGMKANVADDSPGVEEEADESDPRELPYTDALRSAFMRDRSMTNGMIQGHPLHVVEELHARAMAARDEVGMQGVAEHEFELREILQRVRNRLGVFSISAEKAVLKAEAAEALSHPRIGNPMTVLSDASLLLRMLAEFEKEPGDPQRGRHNLTEHGVYATLKERWDTDVSPERLNEAVQVLEDNGYVKVRRGPGTTPYKFSGVEVTAAGRFQYEHQMEKFKSAQAAKGAEQDKPVGTKVFFGHGHSPVWKEVRDYVRDRLDLPWDEFNREATAGYTTQERLEQMLDDAAFAFLVMTAEDERTDGTKVARANVIHEVGLFQGRLGFKKAIVLLEKGCDGFSNIHGVSQIRFEPGNVAAKFDEIRQTLEREGLVTT